MRPNLIFSRFRKLFSRPFKENILVIGTLVCQPTNQKIIDISGIFYPLRGDIHDVNIPTMDEDITNKRHLMLPVHHKDCLVSEFLPENVNTVKLSLTKCWHGGHFVAESRLLNVDTVLDFTWEDWGRQTGSSYLWWMLVIQSLIFKGDDNLQSIMFTMNVSILPALLHHHRLPGGDEMMLLGHRSLSHYYPLSAPEENLNVGV